MDKFLQYEDTQRKPRDPITSDLYDKLKNDLHRGLLNMRQVCDLHVVSMERLRTVKQSEYFDEYQDMLRPRVKKRKPTPIKHSLISRLLKRS